MHPKIVPFSTAVNWISASIVIILFPILTDNVLKGNPTALFAAFAFLCFIVFLLNLKFMVETKHKSEKAIREEFNTMITLNNGD